MTERIVPRRPGEWKDRDSYLMFLRHLAAYYFACIFADGLCVLDLGCGAGYGAATISETAQKVIALDSSLMALLATDSRPAKTAFVTGDGVRLPLRDNSFDLVVSFQVIEHIQDEAQYLNEVRRTLVPGGRFIISTPNRALRLLPFQPPFNPYHVREYDRRSLRKTLSRWFTEVDIRGLRGTPEIMAIEKRRLKQSPVRTYMEFIAQKVLPPVAVETLRDFVRGIERGRRPRLTVQTSPSDSLPFNEDAYSRDDFWVDTDRVKTSLDLIGICRKI